MSFAGYEVCTSRKASLVAATERWFWWTMSATS